MKIEDLSELEMEERTVGLAKKAVPAAPREETKQVIEVEIDSDITDLELQERTIGIPMKPAPAAPAVKARKTETTIKKSGGCCIAFLACGTSAILAIWGITRII